MPSTFMPDWLRKAIFYQVYPQSFCDSNGDGIGDLPGLISKLDYIANLGCNAIWLNPCFVSPFRDAGYDIEDFYQVAPRYGTDQDLIELFKAAAERGIRVCLDFVAGHTATTHPWFIESAKAEPNQYSNWYVWTRHWQEPGGAGNWVNGYSERNGQYLANFFYHQPALNYGYHSPERDRAWQLQVEHPDVLALRAEMRNIMRYWLERGAAGFRVDMAHSLFRNDAGYHAVTVYWQEVRAWLEGEFPEAVLISEWGLPPIAVKAGFHVDLLLHVRSPAYNALFRMEPESNVIPMAGDSFFRRAGAGNIQLFLHDYVQFLHATRNMGYVAVPSGNHDLPRLNFGRTPAELAVCFAFLLTQPGIPFIYYGDEIGMRYLQHLRSHEGGYNRTGSRTPMQWDETPGAGFSTAWPEKFYLPLDDAAERPDVRQQEADHSSLLNTIRSLIALRQAHPALGAEGDFKPVYAAANQYPFVYERVANGERCLVALNPAERAITIPLTGVSGQWSKLVASGADLNKQDEILELTMAPISYGILAAH